jgi:hypothetical protein
MNNAKAELLQAFDGTDNGNLKSFCGVEIKMSDGILLEQANEEICC